MVYSNVVAMQLSGTTVSLMQTLDGVLKLSIGFFLVIR